MVVVWLLLKYLHRGDWVADSNIQEQILWAEESSDISDFTSVCFCIYHDCMQRTYLQTRNCRTQSPLGNLCWRTACNKQPGQAGKVLAEMPASHILICGSESGFPSLLLFPAMRTLGDNGDASLTPTWLIQIEFIVHSFIPRPATAIVVIALCPFGHSLSLWKNQHASFS